MKLDKDEVKRCAAGRWGEIIPAVCGIAFDVLDGKGRPCPLCNQGRDCFSTMKGFPDHGRVLCRKCLPRCGDGFSVVMVAKRCTFPEAVRAVAQHLGIMPAASNGHHATNSKHGTDGHQATVAGVEVRHKAYSAMLECLHLADDHRQALLDRGLTTEAIDAAGYRTLPAPGALDRIESRDAVKDAAGAEWQNVPGMVALEKSFLGRGVLIPLRDEKGRIVGAQVRLDDAGENGRYRFLSGGGVTHPITSHVSPLVKAGKEIRLTEGPLKGDCASSLSGVLTVACPGAGNWRSMLPIVEAIKPASILLAFDMDAATNNAVARTVIECYGELSSKGFQVSIERWDVHHKGIDDALAAGGKIERLEGHAAEAFLRDIAQSAGIDTTKFAANLDADPLAPVPPFSPWRELEPFEENELPAFPTECLPPAFRACVEGVATETQTPPEMAALLVLAVGGAVIAKRVEVRGPNHTEPTNVFVCVVMGPANRKSAVFRIATEPLRKVQKDEIARLSEAIAAEQSERRRAVNRLRKLEDGRELSPEEQSERDALAQKLEAWPEPHYPLLLIEDATPESVVSNLHAQGGRIASMSAEGVVVDLMMGRYSKSGMADFGVYLQGHSGDDITVTRMSRANLHIEKPALTCAYTIQPQVVEMMLSNPASRGRGLPARFIWANPKSMIGSRAPRPEKMEAFCSINYENTIRAMYAVTARTLGLDREADQVFLAWEKELEAMLAEGGVLESCKDWGGKLAGATLRIAGILHTAELQDDLGISAATIRNAIAIAKWAIPHAISVLVGGEWVDGPDIAAAKRFLRWISAEKRCEFTRHELHLGVRSNPLFEKADSLTPGLRILAERGYIRRRLVVSKSGRPPEIFDVNPANSGARNTQKATKPPDPETVEGVSCVPCADSGDFENENDVPWEYDPDEPFGEYR